MGNGSSWLCYGVELKAKKRKILLILSVPPPYGGGEIRALHLKQYFSHLDSVDVLVVRRESANKSSQGKCTIENLIHGFKFIVTAVYKLISIRPYIVFLSVPKTFLAFWRTSIVIYIAHLLKIKVLGELPGANFPFLKWNKFVRITGLHILKKITELRVLGQSIANDLKNKGLSNLLIMDNGIFVPKRNNSSVSRYFQTPLPLLYVGALENYKGIWQSIKAVRVCNLAGVQVEFNLLGEWGDEKQKIEICRFIESKKLGHIIKIHKPQFNESKWEFYFNTSILLHPTFWDGQPLTILEAMGCGLAIITTPVGAIPDTVEHGKNGIVLSENTPENIFTAIKYYYDNRNELQQVAKNNIKTFNERFTLDRYLANMQNWFESFVLPESHTGGK